MLLSHQENEKRRKGAKCDIRFFQRTSGYGEARIFVLFSEFTSGKAVKTAEKLVHKFCAHLRILFCVWTFVDFSIIYIYEVESRAGYPEMLDSETFWGFFIYILLLNVKQLLSIV